MNSRFYLFILIIISLFATCKKDELITDPSATLSFSNDTIFFDTVFTTIGTSTQRVVVRNPARRAVKISSIYVAGGTSSKFRMNVDGIAGSRFTDVVIPARDSIFIFAEVTLDPTNVSNPLIVTDSIVFEVNGHKQDVDLVAWGQDAYYHKPDKFIPGFPPFSIISCNDVWQNDKPHVVYGYAVVDSACSLTINAGTKIHFYNNAGLWIYRYGSLKVNGTKENPVIFTGFRTEEIYKDVPGQWDRIWINESPVDSKIEYAIIENGFIGIQAESWRELTINELSINNTIIKNCSTYGLYAITYNIKGFNNVIANCGSYCAALTVGGKYHFRHTTIGNYWTGKARKTPALFLNDFNSMRLLPLEEALFQNCIVMGNTENEFDFETKSSLFNFRFENSVIKTTRNASNAANFLNCVINPPEPTTNDPFFRDAYKSDFHLTKNAQAIDIGNSSIISDILYDLDAVGRGIPPDAGAYEYIP